MDTEQAASEVQRTGSREHPPLGSDSLTWRRFGDLRTYLVVTWAGLLQSMHPVISAALLKHSDFFDNPTNRLLRSGPPIADVVYSGGEAGARVRGFHVGVQGRDEDGQPYHALNPGPYYWAHATFVATQYALAGYFTEPLTEAEKKQLYRESINWYAQYGLSMRDVPADYDAFCEYWDQMLAEVLRHTEAIRRSPAANHADPGPPPYEWIPGMVWRILGPNVVALQVWIANGLLPPAARDKLGWTWTGRDERLLRLAGGAVRLVFRFVPTRLRYVSQARNAFRAAGVSPAVPAARTR